MNLGETLTAFALGTFAAELADEILCRSVVVGQIPRGKPGTVIGEHLGDGGPRLDATVGSGYLPHTVEQSANREAGSQFELTRFG
jgi:hypothetical protein